MLSGGLGGASAGAVVGLLATRCLSDGLDPVHVLHSAWVTQASWRRLRRGARDAPLSVVNVERTARRLLDPRDRQGRPQHRAPETARQQDPVILHVDVGCLQGLTVPIRGHGPVVDALTHVEAGDFVFGPGDAALRWTSPAGRSALDMALPSMSHPAVFAPRLLDRRGDVEQDRRKGISDLPASDQLWCADGGALVRNPLGGTLAAARRVAPQLTTDPRPRSADARTRVHLLIHPHTAAPDDAGTWTDPARPPRWTATLARTVSSLDPESLYADQRRIEDVNARLRGQTSSRRRSLRCCRRTHRRP